MTQTTMAVQIDETVVEAINNHPLRKMFTRNQLVGGMLQAIVNDLTPATFTKISQAINEQNAKLVSDLLVDGNQLKLIEKTDNIKKTSSDKTPATQSDKKSDA